MGEWHMEHPFMDSRMMGCMLQRGGAWVRHRHLGTRLLQSAITKNTNSGIPQGANVREASLL